MEHPAHWSKIDPLKVSLEKMTTLPSVVEFKYRIGDIFLDPKCESIFEITGYDYFCKAYKVNITIKRNSTTIFQTNLIYEFTLDTLERYDSLESMVDSKKKNYINYKIHYVDIDPNKKVLKQKVQHMNLTMSGLRALAKMLNSMKKRNPNRRVVMVSVVDDDDKFLTVVKFMPEEIRKQQFLTGMKERLLAHAKYECGYDIAIGF